MGALESPFAPATPAVPPARHVLLNRWQHGFPLVPRPYDALGAECGLAGAEVLALLRTGLALGEISRVGAVFGVGAGGAGLLCALRVPPERLGEVAACVSAEPAVSHNYAREHAWNLWFVVTGIDEAPVEATVQRIEQASGLRALRLPMQRVYRIGLGFDLFGEGAAGGGTREAEPVGPGMRPLAARLEDGLPLVDHPFRELGEPIDMDEATVLRVLGRWCDHGTVRRLGVVLRHHEFGIAANAMVVYAPPAPQLDAAGRRLAAQPGVTLCYGRRSAPGWPYTLYAMVHGRERGAVLETIERATAAAGLADVRREVLFSTQRFKQTGSRYFSGGAA